LIKSLLSAEQDTRVAFTACIGVPDLKDIGNNQVIVFERVLTNHGSAYRNTTGIFRAPVEGVYAFHFSAMSVSHHSIDFHLVQDGKVSRTFTNVFKRHGAIVFLKSNVNYNKHFPCCI